MSRLSREKKRDQQRGATPIDVRVPLTGESATVAGTPVTAPPGEDLHQTVLTHLHHLARASGNPVHATIHDARIGYVVPLEVTTDGSSRFTAEPVRMAPPVGAGEESAPTPWPSAGAAPHEESPQLPGSLDEPTRDPAPTFRLRNLSEPQRRTPNRPRPRSYDSCRALGPPGRSYPRRASSARPPSWTRARPRPPPRCHRPTSPTPPGPCRSPIPLRPRPRRPRTQSPPPSRRAPRCPSPGPCPRPVSPQCHSRFRPQSRPPLVPPPPHRSRSPPGRPRSQADPRARVRRRGRGLAGGGAAGGGQRRSRGTRRADQ